MATETIREEARRLGVSPSTVHRRRQRDAAVEADEMPRPVAGLATTAEATLESLMAQVAELQARLGSKAAEGEDAKPIAGGTIPSPKPRRVERDRRRFVVTAAQNDTLVHPGFWSSLLTYAAVNGSEILVSRFGYNKAAWREAKSTKDDEESWYDPAILEHVCDESLELADGLVFCGELDILPTAVDPLSGFDSYTRSASGILPHAKVAMRSLATMKTDPARILYTTGACTQRNYIARKAGQKASFHHTFAALAIEVDEDGAWFVRQLVADDAGHFHDLDRLYTPTGAVPSRVEVVTWGDFHSEKSDSVVDDACFGGSGSVLEQLRPREQHVHDLADFSARNHHNRNDPFFLASMRARGTDIVERDIETCAAKLDRIHRDWCATVVVESNHDQALRRWLGEADGHRDPSNARYWHGLNYRMFLGIERNEEPFIFEVAVREKLREQTGVRFLREDETYVVCREHGGIECSVHGHRGPNGSRGSPKAFRQLGSRVTTAHTHSAGIVDGVYTAGVSGALDMGYNSGPSSWSHSHVLTYANGKRAILTMRGPKWRGAPVRVRERECVA